MNGLVPQNQRGSESGDQALISQAELGPPAAALARQLTAEEQVTVERLERKARAIKTLAFPAAMASAIPVAKDIGAAAFKVYQDGLLQEAGSPTDPIERMLLEQLTLAHHRVAQLHAGAEQAKSLDEIKIFSTAAARLTGEVRRLALAMKQYREPSRKKQFTVVRQQNVSTGSQQVAYLDRSGIPSGQIPFDDVGNEQGSKRLEHVPQTAPIPEPEAASGRTTEPALARPVDAGWSRAAAAVGPQEPAVEVLDGTEDPERQEPVGG